MKKITKIFATIVFVTVVVAMSACAFSASAMTTDNFNVDMIVKENNTFDVTTTINVDFGNESNKRGVIYYIPSKGEIRMRVDGKDIAKNYRNKIENLRVDGYEYETEIENGNRVIKIGDADEYVRGKHTYVIHYTCILNDDGISDFDYFYWNFYPFEWETPIKNGTISITMPKEFDISNIDFSGGEYGGTDTNVVSCSVSGNTVTAKLNRSLNGHESVTGKIILPEGYFSGEHNYNAFSPLIIILIIISTAVVCGLWIAFGRNEKIIPVVSFSPPKGMTSAETGYIIDGTVDDKDVISLIIFWASKGYLSIKQITKKEYEFTKLRPLPEDSKSFELDVFRDLFKSADSVTTESLKFTFYQTIENAKIAIRNYYSGSDGKSVYTKESTFSQGITSLLALVPMAAFMFIELYVQIQSVTFYVAAAILTVATFLLEMNMCRVFEKKDAMKKSSYVLSVITMAILGGIIGVGVLALGAFVLDKLIMSLIIVALTSLLLLLVMGMKTRTSSSNKWMQEILGLRDFIRVAELDRIKMLVDENPEYFYEILPFAYALGLTDQWAKNFESIALNPPQWYYGDFGNGYFSAYLFMNSFNNCMRTTNENMIIKPAPQGGTGGGFTSGGGGFSGGGFSGGGMGGGGGGSW